MFCIVMKASMIPEKILAWILAKILAWILAKILAWILAKILARILIARIFVFFYLISIALKRSIEKRVFYFTRRSDV